MAWGFCRQIPSIIWYEKLLFRRKIGVFSASKSQGRRRQHARTAAARTTYTTSNARTDQGTHELIWVLRMVRFCWFFVCFMYVFLIFYLFFFKTKMKKMIISKNLKKFKLAYLFGLNEVSQKPSEFRPKFRKYWNLLKSLMNKQASPQPSPAPKNNNVVLQQQKFN